MLILGRIIQNKMKNKILVADDDGAMRRLNLRCLKMGFPRYETEEFEDGKSLVSKLEGDVSGVALVLTDNEMPGINGSEIIKNYASREGFKQIPFILVYGGDETIGKQVVRDGAFGYLIKPYDFKNYNELIAEALNFSQ